MSETLVLLLVAVTLTLAYRCWGRPTLPAAAALGLLVGITALTRAEALLLVPFLVLPLTLLLPGLPWRRRAGMLGVASAAVALTMAPWVAYNLSRFEEPVLVSTGEQTLLAGNCRDVYRGPMVGFWTISCIAAVNCPDPADRRGDLLDCVARVEPGHPDVTSQQAEYRRVALDNMKRDRGRLPIVVLAREGRAWGFFRPDQQLQLDGLSSRELELSRLGLGMYYALVVGTVAGIVVLRRRRVPVFPLLSLVGTVTVAVAVTFGETRYRALAEVALALGAAVAVDAALAALGRRRGAALGPTSEGVERPESSALVGSQAV